MSSKIKAWLRGAGRRLSRYRPPYRDSRFWVLQVLVIGIAAGHYFLEAVEILSHLQTLYFVPAILFLVPVVYAALSFGSPGSVATALWVAILAVPNALVFHQELERVGELCQILIVVVVGVILGVQVDRQRRAQRNAEVAAVARQSLESKYRGLFESSPIPILVLNRSAVIVDANPAAGILFGKQSEALRRMPLAQLVGAENVATVIARTDENQGPDPILVINRERGSNATYVQPTRTDVSDGGDGATVQVLLRDVTLEWHRQAGLKAYAAYVLRAQEEERQRIARDLHDDTLQAMALLSMKLDNLIGMKEVSSPKLAEGLEQARGFTKEIIQGLRDFTRALRPPILDDFGLVASVRRLVVDFTERTKIAAQFVLKGEDRRLPQETETGLFRIAQEALRNVEKHSKATRVVVNVTITRHEAMLKVDDNGVGFEIPPLLASGSISGRLGLVGMQERAESLGGKLEVLSARHKGTTVAVSVPIPA